METQQWNRRSGDSCSQLDAEVSKAQMERDDAWAKGYREGYKEAREQAQEEIIRLRNLILVISRIAAGE